MIFYLMSFSFILFDTDFKKIWLCFTWFSYYIFSLLFHSFFSFPNYISFQVVQLDNDELFLIISSYLLCYHIWDQSVLYDYYTLVDIHCSFFFLSFHQTNLILLCNIPDTCILFFVLYFEKKCCMCVKSMHVSCVLCSSVFKRISN